MTRMILNLNLLKKRKREIIDNRKNIKKILRFSFIDRIDKKIIMKKESEP